MRAKHAQVRNRVVIFSELFFPEETSTGFLLTETAKGLVRDSPVWVVCGQPSYARRGERSAKEEKMFGLHIRRCWGFTFNKDWLPGRMLNAVSLNASMFFKALRILKPSDDVLVVTNPPTLPLVVMLAAKLRRCSFRLLVHDVYPEVLAVVGFAERTSIIYKIWDRLTRSVYRAAQGIIVLGRDMRALVIQKDQAFAEKVTWIPNWADVSDVPVGDRTRNPVLERLALNDRFVVQFSGNLGRTHGIDVLLKAAERLDAVSPRVRFLVFGWGSERANIQAKIDRGTVGNVCLPAPFKRSEAAVHLNASDVFVILFRPGMAGISVPSRMYNMLAAGRPIVGVCDERSELALVLLEHDAGWVVPPGDSDALATLLQQISGERQEVARRGRNARRAAEEVYSKERIMERYRAYFREGSLPDFVSCSESFSSWPSTT